MEQLNNLGYLTGGGRMAQVLSLYGALTPQPVESTTWGFVYSQHVALLCAYTVSSQRRITSPRK